MTTPDRPDGPASDDTRNAVEAVTWPVRVAAAWAWRLVIIAIAGYFLVRAISAVYLVAFSLVLALLFTAVLHPLERRLRAVLPGPKSLASALTLLVGFVVLGGVGWFVAWQISSHSSQLGDQVTDFVNRTRNWLQTGPLHLKQADFDNLTKNITKAIQDNQGKLVSGAISTIRTLGEVGGALLLILLTTFFFLRDGDIIWRWVLSLFPRRAHSRLDHAARLGWHTLGGYMRGVVLIALFHATTITVALFILRVPLAPALGVVIFLGSFVPLIGILVSGSLCVAVSLIEHGATAAIVVAVIIVVLVQVEGHVLQPAIMSRTVEVHPLAVAVSVLAGTSLSGIPGALIAVPLVAFVNTVVRALRAPLEAQALAEFPMEPPGEPPREPSGEPTAPTEEGRA